MKPCSLDASAILALLFRRPGHEIVLNRLADSIVSVVTLSEVLATLIESGATPDEARTIVSTLPFEIVPFSYDLAEITASLRRIGESHGISFGGLACIALAKSRGIPVLTAMPDWRDADFEVTFEIVG